MRIVGFLLLLLCCTSCVDKFKPRKELKDTCPTGIEPTYKILFVGWDGVRSDALQTAQTPFLDSLLQQALYCYSVDRGPYTVSTPGWSSILHGVWPDKHGLTENSFKHNRYKQYPDLFHMLRQYKSGYGLATLSNWDAFLQITSDETYAQRFDTDPAMTAAALDLLDHCVPDVLLMHFDYPDESGHSFGFSPTSLEYLNAIEICDAYLGQLLQKIKWRESNFNEQWMIVMTTDHGGEGTGHGNQDDLDQTRKVWYVVRKPGLVSQELSAGKSVDLLPTMLQWLTCPLPDNLDGNPLF